MKAKIKVKVLLDTKVKEKIDWLVNNYPQEIGGWLTGEFGDGYILIDDILFPEQDVTGASVDTSPQSLIKLRKEYGDRCLRIIGHWHSHNTMGAFWSGTDETFIQSYADPREKTIFIVSSKKDGHLVRIELRKPFKVSLNQVGYSVNFGDSVNEEMRAVIEQKVKEKKYTYQSQNVVFSGYDGYSIDDRRGIYDDFDSRYLPNRQQTLNYFQKEKEDAEREAKLRVKERIDWSMWADNSVTVTIKDLSLWEVEEIERDFVDLKPKREGNSELPQNKLKFEFNGKQNATSFVVDIKKYLLGLMVTPIERGEDDFVEF